MMSRPRPNGARVYAGQGLGGPYGAPAKSLTYLSPPSFRAPVQAPSGIFQHSIVVGHDNNRRATTRRTQRRAADVGDARTPLSYAATYTVFTGGITSVEHPELQSPRRSCYTSQTRERTELSPNSRSTPTHSLNFVGSYSLGTQ